MKNMKNMIKVFSTIAVPFKPQKLPNLIHFAIQIQSNKDNSIFLIHVMTNLLETFSIVQ